LLGLGLAAWTGLYLVIQPAAAIVTHRLLDLSAETLIGADRGCAFRALETVT
jgi:hypothetical protein